MSRALRLVGWNALLVIAGVGAVAIGAEAYLRLTAPFFDNSHPRSFHPQAGLIGAPGAEVPWTNRLDFWTVSRNNSLGFLDREPPHPDRAAASCHVAIIGDSFVEARQVAIGDKLQVRLEELAAERLPGANVVTSAFGIHATGQSIRPTISSAGAASCRTRCGRTTITGTPPATATRPKPCWSICSGVRKSVTGSRRRDQGRGLITCPTLPPLPRLRRGSGGRSFPPNSGSHGSL